MRVACVCIYTRTPWHFLYTINRTDFRSIKKKRENKLVCDIWNFFFINFFLFSQFSSMHWRRNFFFLNSNSNTILICNWILIFVTLYGIRAGLLVSRNSAFDNVYLACVCLGMIGKPQSLKHEVMFVRTHVVEYYPITLLSKLEFTLDIFFILSLLISLPLIFNVSISTS